jgi:tRNA pseudouridine38-40 synthase
MPNIRLTLAYDGTEFRGWQIQPGQPTIQGVLTDLLRRLTQEQVTLYAAGRTDAGVHAWGQVAHFKTDSALSPEDLARALNALLPPAIRVRSAEEVASDFHSRWRARAKTYRYSIYRGPVVPPFRWRYVLHHPYPLNFEAMNAAARCFEGRRDFSSFAASTGSEEDDRDREMFREIYRSEMLVVPADPCEGSSPSLPAKPAPDSEEWAYVVRGKSFLRHMVRKIVGTLVEVGRGRLTPADIPRLLELRDTSRSGPTVPPQGLCLVSVEYPAANDSQPRDLD